MTTIHEEDEMEFVDWDAAAPGTGSGLDLTATSEGAIDPLAPALGSNEPDMGLVFQDLDGDDWANWALEHFASTQIAKDTELPTNTEMETGNQTCEPSDTTLYWETPETPCSHCAMGGYQCKRIREGKYKGYCTSCVALRCGCSFGPVVNNLSAEAGETFPANPWPTMGDRPETSVLLEDELAGIIAPEPQAPGGLVSIADDNAEMPPPPINPHNLPKIGARFSRESVKILKNWVTTHSKHPYPTEEEKENLQRMTGLNKTQITNWLANARRRGKIHVTRATSPHIGRGYAQAIDIPQRPGTPSMFESMNPLQRWANSPPENEPASVTAIARAVSASYSQTSSASGRTSPYVSNFSDDGSSRSLCKESSASSFGTSHSSGGSFASSFSHNSRGSSVPSFVRTRGRRRRRRAPPMRSEEALIQPLKTFQCTFCTETFRTKHDWQRHEKSLHLSLERWVCCPDGPKAVNPENNASSCVFCSLADPDNAHVESHNFSGCMERTQEERTFYRKDHLRQHLKLVHNVKFLQWSMDKWRVNTPQIRSRCGFCGIVMDSWSIRVDHLAEHFKTGNTMADWKGDWGFEAPVLEMVENSIPPYLIHDERQTPLPYMASSNPPWSPSNAHELLKVELQHWISTRKFNAGTPPTDAEIQYEACRIIFSADVYSRSPSGTESSWLRDLIMSSDEVTSKAVYQPIRHQAESALASIRINGKSNIFEDCPLERQLQEFVKAKTLLGLTAMDHELQVEACRIIGRTEESSGNPSDQLANWLLRLIYASPNWLQDFRQRAHLPRSEDVVDVDQRSKDPKTIDSTIHNYSRLERELGEYLQMQRSLGVESTDASLQRQARIIIYDIDDEWNQTAADDSEWLAHFRQRHPPKAPSISVSSSSGGSPVTAQQAATPFSQLGGNQTAGMQQGLSGPLGPTTSPVGEGVMNPNSEHLGGGPSSKSPLQVNYSIFNTNTHHHIARGLGRFVASTMSTNNPNRHVPTDDEIKHQARWIIFDDDDPFNTTPADNAEWLARFKREVGLLPKDSGPGFNSTDIWSLSPTMSTDEHVHGSSGSRGRTGFTPPPSYAHHHRQQQPPQNNNNLQSTSTTPTTAASAPAPSPASTRIFNSKELEIGLAEYVRRELHRTGGVFPSDDALRERGRQILGMQSTPCDDPVRLGRFKAALQVQGIASAGASASPAVVTSFSSTTPTMINDGSQLGGLSLGLGAGAHQPQQQQQQSLSYVSGITTGLQSLLAGNAPASSSSSAAATGEPIDMTLNMNMDDMDMDMDMDMDFTTDIGNLIGGVGGAGGGVGGGAISFSEQELSEMLLLDMRDPSKDATTTTTTMRQQHESHLNASPLDDLMIGNRSSDENNGNGNGNSNKGSNSNSNTAGLDFEI